MWSLWVQSIRCFVWITFFGWPTTQKCISEMPVVENRTNNRNAETEMHSKRFRYVLVVACIVRSGCLLLVPRMRNRALSTHTNTHTHERVRSVESQKHVEKTQMTLQPPDKRERNDIISRNWIYILAKPQATEKSLVCLARNENWRLWHWHQCTVSALQSICLCFEFKY